jgi:hypothetical protein
MLRSFKYLALIVFIMLVVSLLSLTSDVVYVDSNNHVVQVNNKKLDYPRPLSKYDLECKIVYIDSNK